MFKIGPFRRSRRVFQRCRLLPKHTHGRSRGRLSCLPLLFGLALTLSHTSNADAFTIFRLEGGLVAEQYYVGAGSHTRQILLEAKIKKGDYKELKEYLISRSLSGEPVNVLELNSDGGLVSEAVDIGRLARRLLLATEIDYKQQCLGSCVFIWAGGVIRSATPSGHGYTVIGLQRPRLDYNALVSPNAGNALNAYTDVEAMARSYLADMQFPAHLTDRMFTLSAASIEILKIHELFDLRCTAPFLDDLLISRCGDLTSSEKQHYDLQGDNMVNGRISKRSFESDPVFWKRKNIYACRATELDKERWQAILNLPNE